MSKLDALYEPLDTGAPLVIAQMGQSLDGCIATRTGDSYYVTGPESLVHLHRLRALVDAVVVGRRTVDLDDPRLTVREVDGDDPLRVVVDLDRRLPEGRKMFSPAEGALRVVHGAAKDGGVVPELGVSSRPVDPVELVAALRARGLQRILVEGGGRLISSFLRAGVLDRMHVTVAPLLIGEGLPGVVPAPVDDLADALRPMSRTFPLGADVLFDLDLAQSKS